jgi:phosphatidylglycerol---prolipoprotein diacylglyceryl transferase
LQLPFEPSINGFPINVHLILEYLAFFVAFRYYIYLRKRTIDLISKINRLSIILGAVIGAFIGSRLFGFLENPNVEINKTNLMLLLNAKTIMGGLFGGLLGVELAKKIIGEKRSSGDLFTFPIILGIIIGRIGCFLNGINEFTYGTSTTLFTGLDLGDGIHRHPIALYEIAFLLFLFIFLRLPFFRVRFGSGILFKTFMLAYFGFRFCIEFIKPNEFFLAGLSSIQWLCIICWMYYLPSMKTYFKHAH